MSETRTVNRLLPLARKAESQAILMRDNPQVGAKEWELLIETLSSLMKSTRNTGAGK